MGAAGSKPVILLGFNLYLDLKNSLPNNPQI
jgi:hypothetical protein